MSFGCRSAWDNPHRALILSRDLMTNGVLCVFLVLVLSVVYGMLMYFVTFVACISLSFDPPHLLAIYCTYLSIRPSIQPSMYRMYLVYLAYPCLSSPSPASSRPSIHVYSLHKTTVDTSRWHFMHSWTEVTWNLSLKAERSGAPILSAFERRYFFINHNQLQSAIIYYRLHLWFSRFIPWICVKWPTVAIIRPISTVVNISSLYHGYTRGNIPVKPGQITISRSDLMVVHHGALHGHFMVSKPGNNATKTNHNDGRW